jgi:transcriptional regulator with XRE-family HTH domain
MEKYNFIDDLTMDWSEEEKLNFFIRKCRANAVIDAGNLVTDALENSGLKQKELAERLQVTKGYISRVMGGMENLTISTLASILGAMGKELKLDVIEEDLDVLQKVENDTIHTYKDWLNVSPQSANNTNPVLDFTYG